MAKANSLDFFLDLINRDSLKFFGLIDIALLVQGFVAFVKDRIEF
jgi:hypothetical protein